MIPAISASNIYSTLGNSNSLVPLAMKDVINSVGLTAASYITGNEAEGRDRFIDEFGTQAIWLFGIPAYKKVLDLTLFKAMGYDPKVDVRVLKDKEIFVRMAEHGSSSINIKARAWVKNSDYWNVYFDITEAVKKAFDENGIEIPFNQLDVHIKQ